MPARADLVAYDMTGTIGTVIANAAGLPVAVGDRVAWTLQYDRSLPSLTAGNPNVYGPTAPIILNVVDLSTSTPLLSAPSGSNVKGQTLYLLAGGPHAGGGAFLTTTYWSAGLASATAHLQLSNIASQQPLPTDDLAKLQLDKIHFDDQSFYYDYLQGTSLPPPPGDPGQLTSFIVQADPLTAPVSSAPEPGALTLFIVGSVGLVSRRLRARFGCH
jgi:hypothetical protein